MADKSCKAAENVAGKYYVDTNCISCGQCVGTAPDNFAESAKTGGMYVKKQPHGDAELGLCKEAMANCPVEAIGDDGE